MTVAKTKAALTMYRNFAFVLGHHAVVRRGATLVVP
jgi:hypothetical protein